MKMMNKFLMAALLAGGALLAGCTSSDDWNAGPEAEGAQVYFSSENVTTYSIAVDDSSVEIEIMRAETAGELDVPVALTAADEAYANLFTGAGSVIFADGADKAVYTIAFDREALEDGSTYALKLEIDDPTLVTTYGYSALTLTLKVPEPFVLLGTGLFREDIISSVFDLPHFEYECEIYENLKKPGLLYLKNVYTNLYYPLLLEDDYDPETDADDYDTFFVIDVSDPKNVVIPEQGLGISLNSAYGEIWTRSNEAGTLENNIITFPQEGLYVAMTLYNDGKWTFYGNADGMFRLALPGAVLTDYSVEIAYAGRFTDASDNNFAEAEVQGGEDVEYIEVALGAGSDPDAVLAAVEAGEIETVRVEGNSGSARLPITEDGTYTLIAISYGEGEAQEVSFVTFKFYAGTAPELSPLEKDYTADDFYGIDKKELFKDWIMWAIDPDDEDGITDRQPITIVTFSESDETYEDEYGEYDLINIEGFGLGITENDAHLWEYYAGFILNFYLHDNIGQWNGYSINYVPYIGGMGTYNAFYEEIMMGGIVDEGYMALAYSGLYNLGSNPEPNGFQWNAYRDEACTNSAGYLIRLYNIMFEDPAVSSLLAKAASLKAPKAVSKNELKTLAQSLSVRENYVETARGMAHRKIDEMLAKKVAKHADNSSFEILNKGSKSARNLHANKQIAIDAVVR